MAQGGMIGFEWPASCRGWQIPELQQFIKRHNLYVVHVDGCMLGVKSTSGDPIKKPWQIVTNVADVAEALKPYRCDGTHTHVPCAGANTKQTGFYPEVFARIIINGFYGPEDGRLWAMPCNRGIEHERVQQK